jgi:hypothetical protein
MRCSHAFVVALVVVAAAATTQAHTQTQAQTQTERSGQTPLDPAARRTANPELVSMLASALNATPKQAEGAAGSLFAAAKSRLQPGDWAQLAGAVPGVAGLLKAAPSAAVGTSGSRDLGALANAVGLDGASGLSTLAEIAAAFNQLGLRPELAAEAISVVTRYVSTHADSRVAQSLADALER